MLKKSLQLGIVLFFIGSGAFAQWGGSSTTTGDIYRDGNVGIGTTTPRALLSLGAGGVGKKMLVYDNPSSNVQAGFGIDMSNTGGRELSIFHPTSDGINGMISFGRNLESTGAYTETMRITGAGNLGIGVTNPSAKLEIRDAGNASLRVGITSNMTNSHVQFLNSLSVSGNGPGTITTSGAVAHDFYNNGNSPSWSGTLIEHYGKDVQTGEYGMDDTRNMGLLKFQNVNNGVIGSNGANIFISPGNIMAACFLSNGNVGIGTKNPGNYKLAVEGKIAARGVKVTTAAFADYVFEPTYKLRPLSSVESYINENKHLPGMPSAKEVEKEGGFELGNMNVKLLEKIEELTLYVIELKKENEQMKKEIKEIKKKK
jgi:hypothetical protein